MTRAANVNRKKLKLFFELLLITILTAKKGIRVEIEFQELMSSIFESEVLIDS